MKCDAIDHRCQPIAAIPTAARESATDHRYSIGSFAARLFWHRFLRARLFERAMRELARRELS